MFNHMIQPSSVTDHRPVGRGERMQSEKVGTNVTMDEKVAERRDRKKSTCCVACGNPKDLKTCSACKQIWYCSRSCQLSDWRNHKDECAELKSKTKSK